MLSLRRPCFSGYSASPWECSVIDFLSGWSSEKTQKHEKPRRYLPPLSACLSAHTTACLSVSDSAATVEWFGTHPSWMCTGAAVRCFGWNGWRCSLGCMPACQTPMQLCMLFCLPVTWWHAPFSVCSTKNQFTCVNVKYVKVFLLHISLLSVWLHMLEVTANAAHSLCCKHKLLTFCCGWDMSKWQKGIWSRISISTHDQRVLPMDQFYLILNVLQIIQVHGEMTWLAKSSQ